MGKFSLRLVCITVCLAAAAGAAGAATFDLTGTWSYSTTGNWVKGPCPKGTDSSGKLQINQSGDSFTLTIVSGMVCKPASLCAYSGTVAGATYTAKNSAVVDSEGGKASNTITFTASSPHAASGSDSSTYVHPQGMSCSWGFNITLSRPAPDGGGPVADSGIGPVSDSGGAPSAEMGGLVDSGAVCTDAAPGGDTDDDGGCAVGAGRVPSSSAAGALLLLLAGVLALRRRR